MSILCNTETPYNVMSITKAAIGLMYHIHEKEFRRWEEFKHEGNVLCSVGAALNMMTGYGDDQWDFDDYRKQVESSPPANLEMYTKQKLAEAEHASSWRYNNLAYQLLASNMPDVAERFGKFMGDKAGDLIKETHTLEYKVDGEQKTARYDVWFKGGKSWKWEHTSAGEPLGPHGLWMTPSFSKDLGEKARKHFDVARGERIQIPVGRGWGNYITESKMKQYWNGWWFSDRCTYAIGNQCQIIAITPKDVQVQIHKMNWLDPLTDEKNWEKEEWFFIDRIEEQFQIGKLTF